MGFIYSLIELLPFEWAEYDFMKNALVAVVIITPVLGFLSTLVVNNKMSFFADTLGHSSLTGIAIGAIVGLSDPKVSMVILGVLFAVMIVFAKSKNRSSTDTTISVFSSTASALGIVMLAAGGGFEKYTSYLVGDFLSITKGDLCVAALVFASLFVIWCVLYNKLSLISVNPTLARSMGINIRLFDAIFSATLAVVVAMSISWVGMLIITSLLVLPAATARNLTNRVRSYTALSVAFSVFCGITGLIISFYINSATGATIVLALSVLYFISLIFTRK